MNQLIVDTIINQYDDLWVLFREETITIKELSIGLLKTFKDYYLYEEEFLYVLRVVSCYVGATPVGCVSLRISDCDLCTPINKYNLLLSRFNYIQEDGGYSL